MQPPAAGDWIAVAGAPLPVDAATAWATTPGSGAVVVFLGVVRDHAEGRDGVTGLTLRGLRGRGGRAARARSPPRRVASGRSIDRVALLHRIGDLELSEASVAVVVSSPHRAEAFEAARFCIDTLKETVPIWKREHWEGGSDWGTGRPTTRSRGR